MRAVVCADGAVGLAVLAWLSEHHRQDIGLVVATRHGEQIVKLATDRGLQVAVWEGSEDLAVRLAADALGVDMGILAWWPHIIKEPLITTPRRGFINFHPSLLPYNRGKHYNFWALVEQSPFGVTLHRVVPGIDAGPILFQRRIPYDWSDTGATLYDRAQAAMIELFTENYPRICVGDYVERPQDPLAGSFHFANEMEAASVIDLDGSTTARSLLNLIRARTFPGKPACRFMDAGRTWEVRLTITEKT